MVLETIGKQIYIGLKIPLWQNLEEKFLHKRVIDRFRLVLIEKGSGILKVGGNRVLFNAPMVFCISENEEVILEKSIQLKASSVYFSPEAVNSALTFENIRSDSAGISEIERNDCILFEPFHIRHNGYHGQLQLTPSTFSRIIQLLGFIGKELGEQKNYYWPCRSRSFFIELLFIAKSIFLISQTDNSVVLDEKSEVCLNQIALYLNSNYEKKITVPDLSKAFNINKIILNENFKERFGMPVIPYLVKLRICLATMLLRNTMIPISEIMERTGFNDLANFTRIFHKEEGLSPGEYREKNCWLLK
ncbi:MAG: AraC family transcriptional regulator [Clostridia bacterium]|nr:AraC family transcriptional regulator [Clostridia bacterium]